MTKPSGDLSGTYGTVSKWTHWVAALVIAAQFGIGWIMPEIDDTTTMTGLIVWHVWVGVAVLAITLLRFMLRHRERVALPASYQRWRRAIASGTHRGLYFLLVLAPVVGWLCASSRGWSIKEGGITWPSMPINLILSDRMGVLHKLLSLALLILILMHMLGTAYGQFWRREKAIQRML